MAEVASHPGEPMLPGIVKEALSHIGTLLDTLFETAEDAIFLMDGERFVDCNPATLRMYGCSTKAEILGRSPGGFSPVQQPSGAISADAARQYVAEAMRGIPQHFEWRASRLDRSEFDAEIRLNGFTVNGVPFLAAVVRDITARRQAEAALRRKSIADELVNGILARCAAGATSQFTEQMEMALTELSAFLGADHGYFFLASPDQATFTCIHEICGAGVAPLALPRDDIPAETFSGAGWGSRADVGCRSLLQVPIRAASGELIGIVGFDAHATEVPWSDTDIVLCQIMGKAFAGMTDRQRAVEKLSEEKAFSEHVIGSLPGLFYLYDADLRLRRWNKNTEALGFSPGELEGKRVGDWFATDEARRVVTRAAQGVLRGEAPIDFLESEILAKDGSPQPYLFSGVRVGSAHGPMLVGVGINIAARVHAEKALAASERNYRELFDVTNDALFIHDETGQVLDVNERARAMFGIAASRGAGLSLNDLSLGVRPYSQADAVAWIRRAMEHGPQVFEWNSRRADGTLFWAEVALRAFRSEGHVRVIASVRDITERKREGLERERLMAEAQAANIAKDQFLAVLSHELRNPLAAIQAGVGLLRRVSPTEDRRLLRAVDVIERNVGLQARLVEDLLDLSRLVRGKLTMKRAPVRLDETVIAAVQSCQADAARADISLEVWATPNLWVDADGDRIQQVVINLVGNAIKFTPKQGQVTVSVTRDGHQGRLIVEDSGVGIEAERLPDIFEMFRQGEVEARRAPGLGIGLALVKSLTELHGGRVWAESQGPGHGSRFIVELPLGAAPRGEAPAPGPEPKPRRIRMLLVEDNHDTRSMLAETFAELGYDVMAAPSGESALDLLGRQDADVIVADIGLPGMDGYVFLREAHNLPSAADAPGFALTGYGQESDVRRARDAGYVDHFVKPFTAEIIDQRIRARLGAF
jgi:two-component system, chemotaxis family, CheB/CheR fusion protein